VTSRHQAPARRPGFKPLFKATRLYPSRCIGLPSPSF
jgi:hypothetical protein